MTLTLSFLPNRENGNMAASTTELEMRNTFIVISHEVKIKKVGNATVLQTGTGDSSIHETGMMNKEN